MSDALLSGLILLGVTGLSTLAYRHHEGYQTIATPLKWTSAIFWGWMGGYFHGYSDGVAKKEQAFGFVSVLLGIVGWAIFLQLLDFMPYITKKKGDEAPKDRDFPHDRVG